MKRLANEKKREAEEKRADEKKRAEEKERAQERRVALQYPSPPNSRAGSAAPESATQGSGLFQSIRNAVLGQPTIAEEDHTAEADHIAEEDRMQDDNDQIQDVENGHTQHVEDDQMQHAEDDQTQGQYDDGNQTDEGSESFQRTVYFRDPQKDLHPVVNTRVDGAFSRKGWMKISLPSLNASYPTHRRHYIVPCAEQNIRWGQLP